MDKSPIKELFCFHDTKHYWFYFFRKYLELISCCGILEMGHHMNMENRTQAAEGRRLSGRCHCLQETRTQSSR